MSATKAVAGAEAIDESPYVGLSYFTEDRADVFFGRDAERTTIIGNLRNARLTLLYAESGVGKSSLLRAGVAARLRELATRDHAARGTARYIPVVFGSWRDEPVPELIAEIELAIEPFVQSGAAAELPRDGLVSALDAASAATGATVLVILDQFEEYFLYGTKEAQAGAFAEQLALAVNRSDLRANFLIAVREDAYAGLGDLFKHRIVNVYGNFLHLEYLDRAAARAAITGPVDHFNAEHPDRDPVRIEPELIEAVLNQVRKGNVSFDYEGKGTVEDVNGAGPTSQRVETPYLQLVMTTLWDEERRAGSDVLQVSTLESLGGAQEIVHTHLERALGDLPDSERETALDVFHHLVTPSGTKIVHRIPDLAAYAGRPEPEVSSLVEKLTSGSQRVLRPVPAAPGEDDGTPRVEIFHDVLAPAILAWRSSQTAVRLERERREAEAKAARERRRALAFGGVAVVALVAMAVAVVALIVARRETDRATASQHTAISVQLARESLTELQSGALVPGVLLSVEAERYANTADARFSLVRALAATEPMQSTFPGFGAAVVAVAFSPDGRLLAAGSANGKVVLEDEATGRATATFQTGSVVNDVRFSPDGRTLAASTKSGTVGLWNMSARHLAATLNAHAGAINGIAFSPDGATLATANDNGTVVLWDLASGRELRTLRGHTAPVNDVKFSPDGRILASASSDHAVVIWNPLTGARLRTLRGHAASVNALAFSPDGRTLASGSDDHTIMLWSVMTGRRLRVLQHHTSFVDDVAFSPDGSTLASAGDDHLVILWNARTGHVLRVLRGHAAAVDSVTFAPSGRLLASSGEDGLAIQWYTTPPLLERVYAGNASGVVGVAASPDGRLVASAGYDHTVRIWNAGTGQLIHTLTGHSDVVQAVAFSPDSQKLVSASDDETLIVWNVATGSPIRTLRYTDFVYGVAYSPDGHTIASAGADGNVVLWNADTGQRLHTLRGHTAQVNAVAFSADGKTLASASDDKSIILWDVASGRRLRELTGHTNPVESVAFNPSGGELASASLDGTVVVWRVATGRPIGQPLRGHSGGVTSVAFAPSGKLIASGGVDDGVILWDLASRLGEPYVAQTGPVAGLAFADGGAGVFSGSYDGTVALLGPLPSAVTAHSVEHRLCGVVRRSLTRAEWAQFVPGQSYRTICPGVLTGRAAA